ncbi:Hypothetical predicted protein [Xyrichtys novacula]|uniref:Uncharacterized protein n=1 Tax=Xyrichtys novacula TaxID=13765 RepID=A0AAV1ERV1_XYRNO|nr:Hypothetical predicted protein [Xyrichtys novacula]
MLPHFDELLLHPDWEVFKSHRQAEVYIQEDPGRPHHLLDSELLHTGLQSAPAQKPASGHHPRETDYTETSMTPSCSRTRLKNEDKDLTFNLVQKTLTQDMEDTRVSTEDQVMKMDDLSVTQGS